MTRLRRLFALSTLMFGLNLSPGFAQQGNDADPLRSWNDSRAKQAILEFVRGTTDMASAKFVPREQRIAVFDQDGTLWASHPMYSQVAYCPDRLPSVVKEKPDYVEAKKQEWCVISMKNDWRRVFPFEPEVVGEPK